MPVELRRVRARLLLEPAPAFTEVDCPCCLGEGHLGDVTRRCPVCLGWREVSTGMAEWYERAICSYVAGRPRTRKWGRMGEGVGARMSEAG